MSEQLRQQFKEAFGEKGAAKLLEGMAQGFETAGVMPLDERRGPFGTETADPGDVIKFRQISDELNKLTKNLPGATDAKLNKIESILMDWERSHESREVKTAAGRLRMMVGRLMGLKSIILDDIGELDDALSGKGTSW